MTTKGKQQPDEWFNQQSEQQRAKAVAVCINDDTIIQASGVTS